MGAYDCLHALHLDGTAPAADEFHLGSIAVSLDVPTASDDDDPAIGLKLGALQLPGGTPRDLDLSLSRLDELDDIALDLVLGLVRAQAASATGSFQALATLLGLGTSTTIPPLPVEQFATIGVGAITTWLDDVLADAARRDRVVRRAGRPDPRVDGDADRGRRPSHRR